MLFTFHKLLCHNLGHMPGNATGQLCCCPFLPFSLSRLRIQLVTLAGFSLFVFGLHWTFSSALFLFFLSIFLILFLRYLCSCGWRFFLFLYSWSSFAGREPKLITELINKVNTLLASALSAKSLLCRAAFSISSRRGYSILATPFPSPPTQRLPSYQLRRRVALSSPLFGALWREMLCIMGKLAQISVSSGVTFIHYDLLTLQRFFFFFVRWTPTYFLSHVGGGSGSRVNWKSFRCLYLQIIKNSPAGRQGRAAVLINASC